MSVYLDASILVSSFTNDALSPQAEKFLLGVVDTIVISDLAAAEFASAIALRVRTRFMTAGDARATLADFDAWTTRVAQAVGIQSADVAVAAGFLRRLDLNLRTADAIHIAISQRIGGRLASFDKGMVQSAVRLKVAVAAV